MQRPEEELIGILQQNNVDFTASLPCEKIKTLARVAGRYLPACSVDARRGGGRHLRRRSASGKRPAMFVQSSGIGNMINALLSLTAFYELPLALFVSRRGVYQEKIEAQFPMGQKTARHAYGAGIGWTEINDREDIAKIAKELPDVYTNNRIHAFFMSPKVWEGSECRVPAAEPRTEAKNGLP